MKIQQLYSALKFCRVFSQPCLRLLKQFQSRHETMENTELLRKMPRHAIESGKPWRYGRPPSKVHGFLLIKPQLCFSHVSHVSFKRLMNGRACDLRSEPLDCKSSAWLNVRFRHLYDIFLSWCLCSVYLPYLAMFSSFSIHFLIKYCQDLACISVYPIWLLVWSQFWAVRVRAPPASTITIR